ncbi:MAG: carboxypeptidase-like regulatory domain-containing protein, partial [Flavobacteriaceae bacterium]|nr:carboxypeptidase-like regulatory domain-containing protein [Flavobacteriaceae bacterium]
MKPFITLLVLLSFCFNTTAQHLKGKVLDAETNLPIENVNVYWSNQDDGTFTDDHGEFDLKLRKRIRQDDLIYFTHVSYAAQKLSFKDLKAQNFTIKLKIDTTQLDAVNLLSRRRLRRQLKYETLPSMKKGTYAFGSAFAAGKIYVFGGDISNETDGVKKTIQNNPNLDVASNFDPGFGFQELLRRINMAYMNSYEGYNSYLQIYNIDRSNWDWKKTELPKRAYHDMIYDKNNNEIYVLGGKRLSMHRKFEYLTNEIEVFDLKNDTVLTDKTNPHQAVNFASFIKDDNIILMGGSIKQKRNGKKVYTDKTHLFDTGTGLWYELGNMPEAKETSGILLGNTIYLIGGFNGESLSGIETYDLN